MIDTHAHIYLEEFDEDRSNIIAAAKEAGIEKILMPAIDSATHKAMVKVEQEYEGCYAMIGLHPCSVNDSFKKELNVVENYLKEKSFIAIGEIGLDFYWDITFRQQQYEAFHQQIQLALTYHLPIVIHSRNATDECIEVVRQYPGITGVFHCFSGNEEQAKKIIDAGLLLGIGGVVTFKNAGLDKVISQIGIDHVVLETDSPYLAPAPYRGKRNVPAYTKLVAEKLAVITSHSIAEVEDLTTDNALKLFKL